MSEDILYKKDQHSLHAGDYRYAIVAARFNAFIVDRLLEGAVNALKDAGAGDAQITVARVPGAFEIPLTCLKFAESGRVDAVIALGCVIRGDTPHFDYVCTESARGISTVALQYKLPVIYGILTTDDIRQAEARAGITASANKGADAANAAMEMLALYAGLREMS